MAPSLHYLHTNTLLSQCAVSVASGYSTGNNEQPELTGALLGLKLVLYGLKSQQWRTTESQKEKKKKKAQEVKPTILSQIEVLTNVPILTKFEHACVSKNGVYTTGLQIFHPLFP